MRATARKLATLAAAAVVGSTLGATSAQAGLIGYYEFENSDATDTSGNGNNGTVGGGAGISFAANGVGGSVAANFSGAGGIANMISLPFDIRAAAGFLPNLTMGAFVQAGNGISSAAKILSHDNGSFDRTLGLDTRSTAGFGYGAFSGIGFLGTGTAPSASGYDFVAVRYNVSQMIVTVNGAHTIGTDFSDFDVGFTNLFVGGNPGFGENWTGQIDNVFIFDNVLTDQELATIQQNGGIDTSPVPVPAAGVLLASVVALSGLSAYRRRK